MAYLSTDFAPQKFYDEHAILDEILIHNGIYSQISQLNVYGIKEKEKIFVRNGWVPGDFDFQLFYFRKMLH